MSLSLRLLLVLGASVLIGFAWPFLALAVGAEEIGWFVAGPLAAAVLGFVVTQRNAPDQGCLVVFVAASSAFAGTLVAWVVYVLIHGVGS